MSLIWIIWMKSVLCSFLHWQKCVCLIQPQTNSTKGSTGVTSPKGTLPPAALVQFPFYFYFCFYTFGTLISLWFCCYNCSLMLADTTIHDLRTSTLCSASNWYRCESLNCFMLFLLHCWETVQNLFMVLLLILHIYIFYSLGSPNQKTPFSWSCYLESSAVLNV